MNRWGLVVLFLLCGPASAQPTPASYLAAEREIHQHDVRLTEIATALENWLAGRMDQSDFLQLLESTRLSPFQRLGPKAGKAAYAQEKQMLQRIQAFAAEKSPDSDGQRALFLSLSGFTESRTKTLMRWRQEKLRLLLAANLTNEQHVYYRWELAWTEVWDREAELTSQLEQAFLDESGAPPPQDLLRSLLKLRLRADNTACPQSLIALDTICKERLTLLTRTAEQLLRLKKRHSSGALTRVRRLSRQLSKMTQDFQEERLARLLEL
jgi:hypothetical protein